MEQATASALAPARPPRTAREVLHLMFGEKHAMHTVIRCMVVRRVVATVWCSCGARWRINDRSAIQALANAPKARIWGTPCRV